MGLFAKTRERFVSGITKELFGTNKTIKILDVGAGTGIAGQMVSIDTCFQIKLFQSSKLGTSLFKT